MVLERLIEGAGAIYWNRRYGADGLMIDTEIKSRVREKGIEARSFAGFLMHEPGKLLTKQKKHYSVFTPFWKRSKRVSIPSIRWRRQSRLWLLSLFRPAKL
jgi:deoxyribodipyrimidine photo-lyase